MSRFHLRRQHYKQHMDSDIRNTCLTLNPVVDDGVDRFVIFAFKEYITIICADVEQW